MKNNSNITSIFALGGLGEVGKNMYVVTHNEEIIIIDAGVIRDRLCNTRCFLFKTK